MENNSYKSDPLKSADIDEYLKAHQDKSLLRFITCGSVDDGKSTLIGRLLYDSKMIFIDQLSELESDSKKMGTQGQKIDFALLVDGLAAEREQGITIDVAYRFFTTNKRKFIVADTPGHEQYTRNMVTGASNADLAVILIDARKGLLKQTRRHSYICHLLGIKNIVVAVNKMDLVDYSQDDFNKIVDDYTIFSKSVGITEFHAIPISGFKGDNITELSKNTYWYEGPTLISYLENIKIDEYQFSEDKFNMIVQWVNRPNSSFRGYSGKVVSGSVRPGDEVRILPNGNKSSIDRIVTYNGDLEVAKIGESVTVTFKEEIDCSRGQVITCANSSIKVADQFETTLIWMHEEELIVGRSYYLKIGSRLVSATVSKPKYKINIHNMEHAAAKTLGLNNIGVANIITDRSIPYTSYEHNKSLGAFILIDKISNATVGAGLINFSLRRAKNIHWQEISISRDHHAEIKNQKPAVLWMTGISGSGKSTIANEVEKILANDNRHTFILDGDNIRHGLTKDLGFTDHDRIENIRRVGEVAKLMTDAGLIVISAFISPFIAERDLVRSMMNDNEFIEVFVDTPIEIAESRDVKGLYAKARSGELKHFTGIDSPYEKPINPEIYIDTTKLSPEEAAEKIIKYLLNR